MYVTFPMCASIIFPMCNVEDFRSQNYPTFQQALLATKGSLNDPSHVYGVPTKPKSVTTANHCTALQ